MLLFTENGIRSIQSSFSPWKSTNLWNQTCRKFIVKISISIWCRSSSERSEGMPSALSLARLWSRGREYCIRGNWMREKGKCAHNCSPCPLLRVDSWGYLACNSNAHSSWWEISQGSRCPPRDWLTYWLRLYSFPNSLTSAKRSRDWFGCFLRTLSISHIGLCCRALSTATCILRFIAYKYNDL